MNLGCLLRAGERDAPALVCPGERPISYGELAGRVDALASGLRASGVRQADRVALILPNGPEAIEVLIAVASLGAAAAPLNPALTGSELSFYFGEIAPQHVLLPTGRFGAAREVVPAGARVIDVGVGDVRGPALRSNGRRAEPATSSNEASPDDVALLLHTSGTTNRPKQVPLLHRNLTASAAHIANHYGLGGSDVSYCVMPLFHVHGLVASALATLLSGGTVVVPRRVAPKHFWDDLHTHGVTWFTAVPTLLYMVLKGRRTGPSDRESLRFVRTCSAPLRDELHARAEDRLSVPVVQAYGMTEASHQISSNPLPPAARLPGSVGEPTGTEIRLLDETGRDVRPGASGEVAIRGPGVMTGYCDSGSNGDSFADGWFRTGDIGRMVDEYLRLEGRIKELIIRGGEKVSPHEVENVLLGHPAVADALCFGVPDEKYGEEVAAAICVRAPLDETDVIRYCREHLAAFKAPKFVRIVGTIPRTATGKPQRKALAAQVAAELAA